MKHPGMCNYVEQLFQELIHCRAFASSRCHRPCAEAVSDERETTVSARSVQTKKKAPLNLPIWMRGIVAPALFHIIAEGLRAFVEVNDVTSHWPRATKMRLRKVDPQLYQYVEQLFRYAFVAAA